jgi:hypothetical protein
VCSDCNPVLGELGDREAQLGARSPLKICTNDAPRVIGAVAHPKSSHESALGHANNPKAAPDGKKFRAARKRRSMVERVIGPVASFQ